MKLKPRKYQDIGIDLIYYHEYCAILLFMGAGKTLIAYLAFRRLMALKGYKRMLVISTLKACIMSWPSEAEKWPALKKLKVKVLHKDEDPDWEENLYTSDANVFVINPQGLPKLVAAHENEPFHYDMIVFDESTMLKHMSSSVSQNGYYLSQFAKKRVLMTASFLSEGIEAVPGQWRVLNPKTFGHDPITAELKYFREYMQQKGPRQWATWKPLPNADRKVMRVIAPHCIWLKQSDYIDLPPIFYIENKVKLNKKAKKIYDEMARDNMVTINKIDVAAMTESALGQTLQQLANGACYYRDLTDYVKSAKGKPPDGWVHFSDDKMEALKELVNSIKTPVLVFYKFKHDRERLEKYFKHIKFLEGKSRTLVSIGKKWNSNQIKLLAVNPASGLQGANLQKGYCEDVVFFGQGFSQEIYSQAIARVYRQGFNGECFKVHHLICEDTIEERIYKVVKEKAEQELKNYKLIEKYRKDRK